MTIEQNQSEATMPAQTQSKPGLESEMHPRRLYMAPGYKGADKLFNQVALITGGTQELGVR